MNLSGTPTKSLTIEVMKALAFYVSLALAAVVIVAIGRAIFERKIVPKKLDAATAPAYSVVIAVAVVLFAWSHLHMHVDSIEGAGIKASIDRLDAKVETIQQQMAGFYKSRRIEKFNKSNWDQVKKLGRTAQGSAILEITLAETPIPESVEIFEGVLPMPADEFHFDGRTVRFIANSDKPDIGLTVMYYPKNEP
jgi:hypothetical protein